MSVRTFHFLVARDNDMLNLSSVTLLVVYLKRVGTLKHFEAQVLLLHHLKAMLTIQYVNHYVGLRMITNN